MDKGDFDAAREIFERILKSGAPSPAAEYEALWDLGLLAWTGDQMEESRRYFSRAGELAAKSGWTKRASDCRAAERIRFAYLRGIEARSGGDGETAKRFFREAASLAQSIPSPGHLLKVLRGWSAIYISTPARAEFKAINERALEAARAFHHGGEILRSLQYLGVHDVANREYSLALHRYLEALHQAQGLGDERSQSVCLNAVATTYATLGSHARAIEYYTEAFRISRQAQTPFLAATILGDLGDVHRRMFAETGNPEDARRALDRYREALTELLAGQSPDMLRSETRAKIGGLLLDLGRSGEALAELRAAAEMAKTKGRPELAAAFSVDLGRAFWAAGDPAQAEDAFNNALRALSNQEDYLTPLAKAHFGLALCAEKKGDLAGALALARRAMEIAASLGEGIGEDLHRAEFSLDWEIILEKVVDLCFEMTERSPAPPFTREMFRTVEIAKAGGLIRRNGAGRAEEGNAAGSRANLDLEALRARRNEILKALASAGSESAERAKSEFDLRQIDDMLAAAGTKPAPSGAALTEPAAVEAVQTDLLDTQTALLEYWLGSERSYGFVIWSGNFGVVELPSSGQIGNSLAAYLSFLSDPDIPAAKGFAAGERLYLELFAPLAEALPPAVDRLIIVPDGPLNSLPFEALRIPDAGARESGYLLDRYTVSYAPSATELLGAARPGLSGRSAAGLLAIGASRYPAPVRPGQEATASPSRIMAAVYADRGIALPALPGIRSEIARIARRFPKDARRTIVGSAATEKAFKAAIAGDHGIVHIASHALSDEIDPMRSAIVFTPESAGDEDGFFQLRELEGLRFSADLVVLSGCRTAGGQRLGHAGVLGLPRSLFRLGARAVVSSLWQVEDRAAGEFMDAFYRDLSGPEDAADALRRAKKTILASKFAHPCFWAGFVLTGRR